MGAVAKIITSFSQSPIFAPLVSAMSKFADIELLPSATELTEILAVNGIRFVPQGAKSSEFCDGYEPRIYLKGEVQTRDQSWHDFFNALVWHQFPQTKKVINRLQYQFIKSRYPSKERLPAENMLTLFDENGAVVIARDPELLTLIREHRWHELFWQRREKIVRDLKVIVIGHGLYEKALNAYVGLTAKCLLMVEQEGPLDSTVSRFLEFKNAQLSTADLSPLPILGLPGWWPENDEEAFYANKDYFRS